MPDPRSALDGSTGVMDDEAFRRMARLEDEHWWFRAKRGLVLDVLAEAGVGGPVLDVGCGTGAMLRTLHQVGHRPAVGTDLSPVAIGAVSAAIVARSRAEQLPIRTGAAHAVVSLDVVEHLDDDVQALGEYRRVVRPGGLVVIAVPAYMWAWSAHDEALGHRRRYTRAGLSNAMTEAGLDVVASTHFHSWLVPLAFLVRKTPVGRLLSSTEEEASLGSPVVNRVLRALTGIERRWVRCRPLRFGLSVLAVGRVPVPEAQSVRREAPGQGSGSKTKLFR